MLWAFLFLNLAFECFGENVLYVEGVPFEVLRIAKRDDAVLLEFPDKAIFTFEQDIEKTLLEYYFDDAKPLDLDKTAQVTSALANAKRFDLLSIPLKRVCKISPERKFDVLLTIKNVSGELIKQANFLPSKDPDPDCIVFFILEGMKLDSLSLSDSTLFFSKLETTFSSIIKTKDLRLIHSFLRTLSMIMDRYPFDGTQHPELNLAKMLSFFILPKFASLDANEANIFAAGLEKYSVLLEEFAKNGLLNCGAFLTFVTASQHGLEEKFVNVYNNCVASLFNFTNFSRDKIAVRTFCSRKSSDCVREIQRLVNSHEFYEISRNVEFVFELGQKFNDQVWRKIKKNILYNLHTKNDKVTLKLIETKYREKLSAFEIFSFFVRQNIVKASILTLFFLGIFTYFIFKIKKSSVLEHNKDEIYRASFVKYSRTKTGYDPEYEKFKNLLERFGLTENATLKEIKEAYFALSKKYHPDHYSGDSSKFIEIKENYEALMELYTKIKEGKIKGA
ncbi:MAG: J domain-containing protein [Deltaproteobacteria bacterium]|nr:J domain-containing protein [Deltaproteobacteria bacterium]